jgi:putative ABC transport system substrate-binding protein
LEAARVITLLGAAGVVSPFAALAQQNDRIGRIGVLLAATTEHDPESEARLAAFRTGLQELGWFEGRNVRIDCRFAGPRRLLLAEYARLPGRRSID